MSNLSGLGSSLGYASQLMIAFRMRYGYITAEYSPTSCDDVSLSSSFVPGPIVLALTVEVDCMTKRSRFRTSFILTQLFMTRQSRASTDTMNTETSAFYRITKHFGS